jgi:hypothetical protein
MVSECQMLLARADAAQSWNLSVAFVVATPIKSGAKSLGYFRGDFPDSHIVWCGAGPIFLKTA